MENQAFEEEQQSRIVQKAIFSQRSSSPTCPFRSPPIEFFDVSASNSDGHVYEDILPSVEDVSKPSGAPFAQDSSSQRRFDDVSYVSPEAPTISLEPDEVSSSFRRNLTLPFRRGISNESTATSSSVRVTNREKNVWQEEDAEAIAENDARKSLDAFSSRDTNTQAQSASLQVECRRNRRRRKKDCKHCRSKAVASANARLCDDEHRETEAVLRKNRNNENHRSYTLGSNDPQTILDPCNLGILVAHSPAAIAEEFKGGNNSSTVFTISEKVGSSPSNTLKLIEYQRNEANGARAIQNEGKALITPEKNRTGMRVNSIYSQDRWYAKEATIFFTDIKEHGTFQRAYSLPARTQTPSSQNRMNLRRSVRGEPPPHPARLHKHRHGWTLHLARPLEGSRCTRSRIFLLILVLALLGIAAVALYIVFEPEKLQVIQQYLKSSSSSNSSNNSSSVNTLSAGTFLSSLRNDQRDDASTKATSTTMGSTLIAGVLLSGDQSFPENSSTMWTVQETETEATTLNSTRYCDDCLTGEVCVALVDEEVPTCRIGLDREDPTGCAGFCLINKQKCHRLDVDAFRCVEVEHYCLDDEWTCSNTVCIPLDKRCDGHMNCYDHSDEYNCVCDPETHFQCGNETSCLPLERRCDGKIDCWDAADEINCTLACPSENEFTCSNGQCILRARFCDGLQDCLDGSDEPHGCQGRCNKHEFTCQNSRCIAKAVKCNGIDDCGDGTDERHCRNRFP